MVRILKGCQVPLRDPSGGIRFWVKAPVTEYEDFLGDLRRFLELSLEAAGRPSGTRLLNFLADMISLYFRAPLLREPVEGLQTSPLKLYLAWRILVENPAAEADMAGMDAGNLAQHLSDVLRSGELNRVIELIDTGWRRGADVLTRIPADTRPGMNCSSLLIHWISVASLAWAMGVEENLSGEELALMRLAALLHDVGKPVNPRAHVMEGEKIVRKLLSGLVPGDHLSAVLEIVGSHHDGKYKGRHARAVEILRNADKDSASADRLGSLVDEIVVPRLAEILGVDEETVKKEYFGSGPQVWSNWESLESERPGTVEELTELFARALASGIGRRRELPGGRGVPEVSAVLVDLGGIQDFVWGAEKLSLVSASSHIVDLATKFNSLRYLQTVLLRDEGVWYPFEGFLYAAGGNILALAPKRLKSAVMEALRESYSKEVLGFSGLTTRVVSAEFSTDYAGLRSNLESKIMVEKFGLRDSRGVELTGLEAVCEFCGRRAATERYSVGGEEYLVCEDCMRKFEFFQGVGGHVRDRWERGIPIREGREARRVTDYFGSGWSDEVGEGEETKRISEVVMEVIAGHDLEDLPSPKRKLNLAVLKLDGNLMGAFMASAVSLSDVLERSARIDLAMKNAFRKALEAAASGVREVAGAEAAGRECSRMILGLQYMGGDDAMLFSPSWAAFPLAVTMMLEFSREMGHSFDPEECLSTGATLSAGLAVAPPAHNVWLLSGAVEELLEAAKEVGRFPSSGGGLAFDVVEGGTLSGLVARARRLEMAERGLSTQPWTLKPRIESGCDEFRHLRGSEGEVGSLGGAAGTTDILSMAEVVLGVPPVGKEPSDSDLERYYAELFRRSYEAFSSELAESGGKSRVRALRDVVREAGEVPSQFGVLLGGAGFHEVVRLYLYRELVRNRGGEDASEREGGVSGPVESVRKGDVVRMLLSSTPPGGRMPLEDLNRLCKIITGGAR